MENWEKREKERVRMGGRRKVVGRKYTYFWNPKTKVWMKAKRLKTGKLKIVGKATKSEVERARK